MDTFKTAKFRQIVVGVLVHIVTGVWYHPPLPGL